MKLHFKFDMHTLCNKILKEQCETLGLEYSLLTFGEIELAQNISDVLFVTLCANLKHYGIEPIENPKNILVQKTKDAIMQIVHVDEALPNVKLSAYLADKLNHSYGYIANVFSDVTYTSIESYIIMQKIERAKLLITKYQLTFTEISYRLNYSSVAHFSTQFKNVTGLTPSMFQRIVNKRRDFLQGESV